MRHSQNVRSHPTPRLDRPWSKRSSWRKHATLHGKNSPSTTRSTSLGIAEPIGFRHTLYVRKTMASHPNSSGLQAWRVSCHPPLYRVSKCPSRGGGRNIHFRNLLAKTLTHKKSERSLQGPTPLQGEQVPQPGGGGIFPKVGGLFEIYMVFRDAAWRNARSV